MQLIVAQSLVLNESVPRSPQFCSRILAFLGKGKRNRLLEQPQSTNKGTVSPAWDRLMSGAEDDAASSCGPLHQTGVLLLADWDAGTLCVTSSDRQHVYVSRRYNTRPRNEASADFEKHSGNRLKTGRRWSRDRTLSARIRSASWGKSFTSRLDSVEIRLGRR